MPGCFQSAQQESDTRTKTPEQKQLMRDFIDLYGRELGKGADIYPESRVAPLTTLQEKSLAGAGRFTDYFSEPQTAGTPLFAETGQATKGLLTGETGAKPLTSQNVEDYFQKGIVDPNLAYLEKETLPGIDIDYSGPGFHGSARSHERVEARKDLGEWLGTQRSGLEWDVLQSNQALAEGKASRSLATLGPAMAYGQVPTQEIKNNIEIATQKLGGLNQIFGFGQADQTQAQMELQDEIVRFAELNQITDPENLQILLTLLGMSMTESSAWSEGAGMGYAMFANPQTGGAAMQGIGKLFASDIRIKENIQPVGDCLEKVSKLNPFTYNYIGQNDKRMGLMAQDVEKVLPGAVVEIDGVKHVDTYALQALIVGAINELMRK